MSTLTQHSTETTTPPWLDLRKVEGLRYGQVYIVVHDQQVTQIECLEKTRLGNSSRPGARPDHDA
jgi:hypothetical protein